MNCDSSASELWRCGSRAVRAGAGADKVPRWSTAECAPRSDCHTRGLHRLASCAVPRACEAVMFASIRRALPTPCTAHAHAQTCQEHAKPRAMRWPILSICHGQLCTCFQPEVAWCWHSHYWRVTGSAV